MALSIKYGETTVYSRFDLTNYLTSVGKTMGDFQEATFMLKEDPKVSDEEAGYTATTATGIAENGNSLDVLILDYANLIADRRYFIGLGVKFTGDTNFREVPLSDSTRTISFSQDVIRG
jgi:hypothetical protein